MSIKRTKQVNKGRDRDGGDAWVKPAQPEKTWAEQLEGKSDDLFAPYSLSSKFDKGALIQHPTFGRGIVTSSIGARIEVLFEAGVKKLGHAG